MCLGYHGCPSEIRPHDVFHMVVDLHQVLNPCPMNRENRPLITDELVWIWKLTHWSSRIQEIADHFRRIYAIFLGSIKENRKMSTCMSPVGLGKARILTDTLCPRISLDTVFHVGEVSWNVAKNQWVKLQPALPTWAVHSVHCAARGMQSPPFTLVGAGANEPVHWFLGGKGLGIPQETSVWVGSPTSSLCRCP